MLSTVLAALGTALAVGATVATASVEGAAGSSDLPLALSGAVTQAAGTDPALAPQLYQASRTGAGAYEVPVGEAGAFRVSLRFATSTVLARRQRVFDVYAERAVGAKGVDLSGRGGTRPAGVVSFDTRVTDGTLNLQLTSSRAAARLTGVDVERLATPAPLPDGELQTPPSGASVTCGYGTFRAGSWPGACWRPYGDHSPFNRKIPAQPRLLPNSSSMVSKVLTMGPVPNLVVKPDTTSDWYHPIYYSQATDPVYTVHCTRSWGTCEIEGMKVRIPSAARAAGGGDGHMTVIDQVTGWEYDFWQVLDKPASGGTIAISWGGRTQITGDGLESAATAAHFGLHAGMIRAAELEAGRIDHALFLVVGCSAGTHVWPALGQGSPCSDTTNAPAIGQYFQLAMTPSEIDALSVPRWKKTILKALAEYGAFVGDTGGNESFGFMFESGSSYTSFGVEDPMQTFAKKQSSGVALWNGGYYFDMASGVDWRRMRALDPCVPKQTC